jgi:hypothetical protein
LEHLLARIDAPRLDYPNITFSMVLDFDVPQLRQFIGRAEEFNTFDRAYLWIYDLSIHLYLTLIQGQSITAGGSSYEST